MVASTAAPNLRLAGGVGGVQMQVSGLQTFTESDTWKRTDIPALLKEGASYFLDDKDVKFVPCSGGVNNLVQYAMTSTGEKYIMRIYNNGGNTKRVRFEHEVLAALDPQRDKLAFKVPKYLGTLKDPKVTFVKLSSGAEACMSEVIPGTLPKNADPYILGKAAGELCKALTECKVEAPCPTPPYFKIYGVHHAMSEEVFYEEIKKPEFDCIRNTALPKLVAELERLDKQMIGAEAIKRNEGKYPIQLIHGDLHYDNVLVDGDKVSGLLDFEFAAQDWRAMEPAVCLTKYAADKEPFKLMDAFLDGFVEKGVLTRAEVAGLPDMINLRIMSNVIYFIGRAIAKEDTLEALTSRADMYASRIEWVNTNADKLIKSLTAKMEAKLGKDFK
jgi:Ser/Thr protein kinase RdoA (MazF antagonist)